MIVDLAFERSFVLNLQIAHVVVRKIALGSENHTDCVLAIAVGHHIAQEPDFLLVFDDSVQTLALVWTTVLGKLVVVDLFVAAIAVLVVDPFAVAIAVLVVDPFAVAIAVLVAVLLDWTALWVLVHAWASFLSYA